MGITGLLPLLKSIHKPCHLKKFKGQTLGVDAYGWLHRGVVACAIDLALDRPTRRHIDYVLHRVRMLVHFGIKPYLVFDGDHLPSKAKTEASRRERRNDAKREGLELLNAGKTAQAHKTLQKAIDVTPQMTHELIQELKKLDVTYVVAPYEADAQLAYLERKGIINGVLSEDSDLLVFGVHRLLTKLDQYGNCIEVNRNEFTAVRDISLIGWTDADFRRMAILSGCDYLDSLPNMGLKTAYRLVRKHKAIDKILRTIQFEGMPIPPDYAAKFEQAERSFVHHRVFCPIAKELVFLTELPHGISESDMPYLGEQVEAQTAVLVASGELDPMTKTPIPVRAKSSKGGLPLATKAPKFGENRRHTFGTTEDLKDNKRVTSFFKKRTPLAELDPNSLTPSPSQQRLLQRHSNASWLATPSPSPAIHSAPRAVPTRSDTETFLSNASRLSDYQPPKRQRLCSDAEEPHNLVNDVASPFFAQMSSTPSKIPGKVKKAKRATFGVFSDDSVDDIFSQMPEVAHDVADVIDHENDRFQSVAGGREVEGEVEVVPASSPPRLDETEAPSFADTGSGTSSLTSQKSNISQSTAATSVAGDADGESFIDLLDYHVRNQSANFLDKFSYRAERPSAPSFAGVTKSNDAAVTTASPSRPTSGQVNQTMEEKVQLCKTAFEEPARRKPQRSGMLTQSASHPALHKSKSSICVQGHVDSDIPCQGSVIKGNRGLRVEDVSLFSEPEKCTAFQGSEDLIIPKSDDEDDDLPARGTPLDLQRFAFQAR